MRMNLLMLDEKILENLYKKKYNKYFLYLNDACEQCNIFGCGDCHIRIMKEFKRKKEDEICSVDNGTGRE